MRYIRNQYPKLVRQLSCNEMINTFVYENKNFFFVIVRGQDAFGSFEIHFKNLLNNISNSWVNKNYLNFSYVLRKCSYYKSICKIWVVFPWIYLTLYFKKDHVCTNN